MCVLNNEVSAINSCKQKPIIDRIIELANQWLLEVATRTLIGALRFCFCSWDSAFIGTPFSGRYQDSQDKSYYCY